MAFQFPKYRHEPGTVQGCGTTFYGQRDFRKDGSYITTEFFVIILIPIVPLRSLRVRDQGATEPKIKIGFSSARNYAIYEKTWPNWKQVLCVYGYACFFISWVIFIAYMSSYFVQSMNNTLAGILIFVSIILPAFMPLVFRFFARRNLRD
jgi:ABC-type spermidine/putrescine transport system permease subunit I